MRTPRMLAAGCLLVLVAPAQDPASVPRAGRLHFAATLESTRSTEVGGTGRVVRSVARTDYVHLLAPGHSRIVLQAVATERSVDGRTVEASGLSRDQAVWLEPDGTRQTTARQDAPEQLRARMDALGEPWFALELDDDGRETARRVLVAAEVVELFTAQQLALAGFFHVPFPAAEDAWDVARTLPADGALTGTLRYTKAAQPTEAGLIEVSVTGDLAAAGSAPDASPFAVSGLQLYDPMLRAWVGGRISLGGDGRNLVLNLERIAAPLVAGGEFGVGADAIRWRRPAHWSETEGDPFRQVALTVTKDLSCGLTLLPGDGGGFAANLRRWRLQLGLEAEGEAARQGVESIEVLGRPANLVRLDGAPAADGRAAVRTLALVCSLDGHTLFVKLSGPIASVRAAEADFEAFCTGLEFVREEDDAPAGEGKEQAAVPTPEQARPILIEAAGHLDGGRNQRARDLLDPLLATGYEDHTALFLRACARGRLGDTPGALADLDRALALAPDFGRGFAERAYHHYQAGDFVASLADYDRALELGQSTAPVHGERGDVLAELGRFHDAMESYRLATVAAPDWPHAWAGWAHAAESLGDLATARLQYQRAVVLAPRIEEWVRSLARVLYGVGETDLAMRTVGRIETENLHANALRELGDLALRAGDLELAEPLLRDAAERADGELATRCLLSLGNVHLARGDDDAAIVVLTEARASADESLRVWTELMQWCARARRDGLDAAARWWAGQAGDAVPAPDSIERELMLLCLAGDGLDDVERSTVGRGFEACAPLFCAAWRQLVAGNQAEADRLLRLCVNTGAWHWTQWQLAVVLLEQRLDGAELEADLGWNCEVVVDDQGVARHAVVRELTPGGAAERQGVQVGDLITGVRQRAFTADAWQEACAVRRVGGFVLFDLSRDGTIEEWFVTAGVALGD